MLLDSTSLSAKSQSLVHIFFVVVQFNSTPNRTKGPIKKSKETKHNATEARTLTRVAARRARSVEVTAAQAHAEVSSIAVCTYAALKTTEGLRKWRHYGCVYT